jgi:hypothetical protein
MRRYLHKLLASNKNFILSQAVALNGFLQLLMKQRNTGEKWTRREKRRLKQQLKILSLSIPALIIFLLPGGGILLPILAEALDRRKEKR